GVPMSRCESGQPDNGTLRPEPAPELTRGSLVFDGDPPAAPAPPLGNGTPMAFPHSRSDNHTLDPCAGSPAPASPFAKPAPEPPAPEADTPTGTATANPPGVKPSEAPPDGDLPQRIGRYYIQRLLGEGTFGRVYLAHDPVLERAVALKVAKEGLQ